MERDFGATSARIRRDVDDLQDRPALPTAGDTSGRAPRDKLQRCRPSSGAETLQPAAVSGALSPISRRGETSPEVVRELSGLSAARRENR